MHIHIPLFKLIDRSMSAAKNLVGEGEARSNQPKLPMKSLPTWRDGVQAPEETTPIQENKRKGTSKIKTLRSVKPRVQWQAQGPVLHGPHPVIDTPMGQHWITLQSGVDNMAKPLRGHTSEATEAGPPSFPVICPKCKLGTSISWRMTRPAIGNPPYNRSNTSTISCRMCEDQFLASKWICFTCQRPMAACVCIFKLLLLKWEPWQHRILDPLGIPQTLPRGRNDTQQAKSATAGLEQIAPHIMPIIEQHQSTTETGLTTFIHTQAWQVSNQGHGPSYDGSAAPADGHRMMKFTTLELQLPTQFLVLYHGTTTVVRSRSSQEPSAMLVFMDRNCLQHGCMSEARRCLNLMLAPWFAHGASMKYSCIAEAPPSIPEKSLA